MSEQYSRSIELHSEAEKTLAGGVSSNFRLNEKPTPLYFEKAQGSHLYSADGEELIDYALGMGPAILGHAHPAVNSAVADSLANGQLFAGQHAAEGQLARLVCSIVPCAERVRFGLSGSEMVQAALRVSRAFTGRSKVVKFEGHYHGWFDSIFSGIRANQTVGEKGSALAESEGQNSSSLGDLLVMPWNDLDALKTALRGRENEIAAMIMEPILCNTAVIIPKPDFIKGVREFCTQHGIVLIFDEVITGFRVGLTGAEGLLGVTPDLAVFAKALANGFPASCLAGRADIMDLIAAGRVMHGGTYNTNVVSTVATIATIHELQRDNGAIYARMRERGEALMDGIRAAAKKHKTPLVVQGLGPVFHTAFADGEISDYRTWAARADSNKLAAFLVALLNHGVRVTRRGTWFLSGAHSEKDIDVTIAAVDRALAEIA